MTDLPGHADLDLARRIDELCDQFEEEFRAGQTPSIAEWLQKVPDKEQPGLLRLVLPLELELQQEIGATPAVEAYVSELGRHGEIVHELFEEFMRSAADRVPTETVELPELPLSVPREVGRYRLLKPIGHGGMGSVYLAQHKSLNRRAAVKLLPSHALQNDDALQRFRREMEAVGQLNHAHIVQAYDASDERGLYFLAMEYVRGLDLGKLVQRVGPLRSADACEIVRQAALGLQHAHEHGFVHRDIKPSNIMLKPTGQVKILDFGLARLQSTDISAGDVTATGQVVGTLMYISPEQCSDAHNVDIRGDLYSLGCTLYFLLTGRRPFDGDQYKNLLRLIQAHASEPLRPLAESNVVVPSGLEQILKKLTAKNPDERFQTPAELARALKRFCKRSDLKRLFGTEARVTRQDVETTEEGKSTDSQGMLIATHPFITSDEEDFSYRKWDEHRKQVGQPTQRTIHGAFKLSIVLVALAVIVALGTVVYINTGHGVLEVQVDSQDIQFLVDETNRGDYLLETRGGKYFIRIVLRSGKHTLEVKKEGFTSYTDEFRITRDGEVSLTARFLPQPTAPSPQVPDEPPRATVFPPPTLTSHELLTHPQYEWSEPVLLSPIVNRERNDGTPALTGDGTVMVFRSEREDGNWWMAHRPRIDVPFGEPAALNLSGANTDMHGLALSRDGLELYLSMDREGGHGGHDLWMYRRDSLRDPFDGLPVNLGPLVNSDMDDMEPSLSADGLILVFGSSRDGRQGNFDLWMCTRSSPDEPFEEPVPLPGLVNSRVPEWGPRIADDGLAIIFKSKRSGGYGDADLWLSTRPDRDSVFGIPRNLGPKINSKSYDAGQFLLSDRRTFYFTRIEHPDGHGGRDIWYTQLTWKEQYALRFNGRTSRVKVRDFKYDGKKPMTVEAIVRPESVAYGSSVLANTESSGFLLDLDRQNRWRFGVHNGRTYVEALSDQPATTSQPLHIAGTFDGKRVTLFVNGERQAAAPEFTGTFNPSSLPLVVGANPTPRIARYSSHFAGDIHAVRISDGVLYEEDFPPPPGLATAETTLFLLPLNEGFGVFTEDISGNGHHGEIYDAQWVLQPEPGAETPAPKAADESLTPDPRIEELRQLVQSLPGDPEDPSVTEAWEQTLDYHIEKLGTRSAIESARLLRQIASPFDRLKREDVDEYELWFAGAGDPDAVPPELVDIIGDSRLKHWDRVLTADWSRDGSLLASGGEDNRIIIWDAETGRAKHILLEQADIVRCVRFSPDGSLLASCTGLYQTGDNPLNHEIRLWNTSTGELVRTLRGEHTSTVRSLDFSANGEILASGGYDNRVVLWNLDNNTRTLLEGHEDLVFCVAFHPKNPLLASSSRDGTVRVWHSVTGKVTDAVTKHSGDIGVVTFNDDGTLLASGANDQTSFLWAVGDDGSLKQAGVLAGHQSMITALAFQPGGRLIASGCNHGEIRLWNVDTGLPVDDPPMPFEPWSNGRGISSVTFSHDGSQLLAARRDGSIRIWDAETMRPAMTIDGVTSDFAVSDVDPRAQFLVSVGTDGSAHLWDLIDRTAFRKLEETTLPQHAVAASTNPPRFATSYQGATSSKSVRLWSIDGNLLWAPEDWHWTHRLDLSPNGERLGTFSWRPRSILRVYDTKTGNRRFEKPLDKLRIDALRFRPDGAALAGGIETSDKKSHTIHLWSAEDGHELASPLHGHTARVTNLQHTADGRTLYSLSDAAKELFVWDMTAKPPRMTSSLIPAGIATEMGTLSGMAVSPDGTQVAVADMKGLIRIWDTTVNRVVKTITMGGVQRRFRDIFYAPDSRHLIVPDVNGVIYVFRAFEWSFATKLHQAIATAPKAPAFPCDSSAAKKHQSEFADHLEVSPVHENSLGMKLMLIPPGEFLMGSTAEQVQQVLSDEPNLERFTTREQPQHPVNITQPYYLGAHEVTASAFARFVRSGDSSASSEIRKPDGDPVVQVSWIDAVKFCNWLSQKEGLSPFYQIDGDQVSVVGNAGYRLPTEAEWEYASRAGNAGDFYFTSNPGTLDDHAWFSGNSENRVHPVGQKAANPWGLHDMHGNVWEWCQDWFSPYSETRTINPSGPAIGRERLLRGGSWNYPGTLVRSASRRRNEPTFRSESIGFRVARSVSEQDLGSVGGQSGAVTRRTPIPDGPSGELVSFDRHTARVMSVDVSPDGKFGLTGSYDGTVRLWELATGAEVYSFTHEPTSSGSPPRVVYVGISPDGKFACSTSREEHFVSVWDITNRKLHTKLLHPGNVLHFGFDASGEHVRTLASNVFREFSIADGQEVRSEQLPEARRRTQFSSDGRYFLNSIRLSGQVHGIVELWDCESVELIQTFHVPVIEDPTLAYDGDVPGMAVAKDGQIVLTGGTDSAVRLWSVATGEELLHMQGHEHDRIYSLDISEDDQYAVSCTSGQLVNGDYYRSRDRSVRLWHLRTGQAVHTFTGHKSHIFQVVITPDQRFAVSASYDGTSRVWRLPRPMPVDPLPADLQTVLDSTRAEPPFIEDDFEDPAHGLGLPSPGDHKRSRTVVKRFYEGGRYHLQLQPGDYRTTWNSRHRDLSACAIEVTGRVTGPASDGWSFRLTTRADNVTTGFEVSIDSDGRLSAGPIEHERLATVRADFGPITHPAIRPHGEFNKVLLVVQGRQIGILVNDHLVVPTFTIDRDITPGVLAFSALPRKDGCQVEFEGYRIWDISMLDSNYPDNLPEVAGFANRGMALSPTGILFVSSTLDHSVLRYDTAEGQWISPCERRPQLLTPHGVTIGPDGNVYVVGTHSGKILKFDTQGGQWLGTFASDVPYPVGLTLGPDKNFYVTCMRRNEVLKLDGRTGEHLGVFVTAGAGELSRPTGLAFGPDGTLYVSSEANDRVLRFHGRDGAFVSTFASGNGLGFPQYLAFTPDGDLYVSGRRAVLRYASDGSLKETIGQLNSPHGLAPAQDGRLYVVEGGIGLIRVYDPETGELMFLDGEPVDYALRLDGKSSQVEVEGFEYSGEHPITVEAIVRPAELHSPNESDVVSNWENSGFGLKLDPDNHWRFGVHNGEDYVTAESDEPQQKIEWVHVAGTFDGRSVVLYVNGRRQQAAPAFDGTYKASPVPLLIGANPQRDNRHRSYFQGEIRAVRISRSVVYAEDFVPPEDFAKSGETLLLLPLNAGQGPAARDTSGNDHHGTLHHAQWLPQFRGE